MSIIYYEFLGLGKVQRFSKEFAIITEYILIIPAILWSTNFKYTLQLSLMKRFSWCLKMKLQ